MFTVILIDTKFLRRHIFSKGRSCSTMTHLIHDLKDKILLVEQNDQLHLRLYQTKNHHENISISIINMIIISIHQLPMNGQFLLELREESTEKSIASLRKWSHAHQPEERTFIVLTLIFSSLYLVTFRGLLSRNSDLSIDETDFILLDLFVFFQDSEEYLLSEKNN